MRRAETRGQQTEAELRLSNWKEASREEVERVRQEMLALAEQLQDLALENSNLRNEREGLIKSMADAVRKRALYHPKEPKIICKRGLLTEGTA